MDFDTTSEGCRGYHSEGDKLSASAFRRYRAPAVFVLPSLVDKTTDRRRQVPDGLGTTPGARQAVDSERLLGAIARG